jgi:hypothetical protein
MSMVEAGIELPRLGDGTTKPNHDLIVKSGWLEKTLKIVFL